MIFCCLMRDSPAGRSAPFPGWASWRSPGTHGTSPRVQRWSFPCGWPRVCTRGRGGWCRSKCPRCTERAGGPCSVPIPPWWTSRRWDHTTTAWGPRCCTLTAQKTQMLPSHCCRRSSVGSGGPWTPPRTPTTRTRPCWWSVWTAWRGRCSGRGRAVSTASRAGRRVGPRTSPPPLWSSTTARGRWPTLSPELPSATGGSLGKPPDRRFPLTTSIAPPHTPTHWLHRPPQTDPSSASKMSFRGRARRAD